MEQILEHFKTITKIPRCSFHAKPMQEYIVDFARQKGFEVFEDTAGNVLCRKGEPKVCLQAHYDMVCIGACDPIELAIEGNLLKAKASTLGADNGMGMALMFWAMEHYSDLECLFSADEEVGLIGASNFSHPLQASYLLNLDSEEEGKICIGCAGGVDIVATLPLHVSPLAQDLLVYDVHAQGFLGGHSGVDIDKNIDSAIEVLVKALAQKELIVLHLEGGERRNAISKEAKAIVASAKPLAFEDARLHVRVSEALISEGIAQSARVLEMLSGFEQGVHRYDEALKMPSTSINMGVLGIKEGVLEVVCAARAMDDENLAILASQTEAFFKAYGCETRQEHWHGAWKPYAGHFAHRVQHIMLRHYPEVHMYAIHAGLECGELIARQEKPIEALSIGPTIHFPHSTQECCELDSVERTLQIVKTILDEVDQWH